MGINLNNFLNYKNKDQKMGDFQDLDHLDGVSISSTSGNLYNNKRDDLVLFYFRKGANHASLYTQSKLVSENIKWNLKIKNKKIKALLVNTRNANVFTPNGDGQNDLFEIPGYYKLGGPCQFVVNDRWGNIIYQSLNYANDWDGTGIGGITAVPGLYYYTISKFKSKTIN